MASLLYLLYINIYSQQDLISEVNNAGTSPSPNIPGQRNSDKLKLNESQYQSRSSDLDAGYI
jgi:hypothetical protein